METVEPQRPDGGSLLRPTSRTSPSIFYNMRAPPRYWIANATDMVEPRGPDSSQHVEIEDGFRGRPGSVDIDESRKETLHAGSAQILDSYRNGQRRASEDRFGSACRNRRRLPWALWHRRHYCRKKQNKCSNSRSSDNNRSTNSRRRSKRNVGSTELQTMEDTKVNT